MSIKQIVKYIIKTDWKQKRSDYGRWKTLQAACREMSQDVDNEETAIRTVFAGCSYDGTRSCLNFVYPSSLDSNEKLVIIPCKHFDASHECTEANCKYRAQNARYISRQNQYARVKEMHKNFWAEKFANVK